MTMTRKSAAAVNPSPYDSPADWKRARKLLAESFYKELKSNGLNARQIIELSNELLTLVGDDFGRSTERSL
jgi:hypothetical protein